VVLADTSVWVDFLRSGRGEPSNAFDDLLAGRRLLMCGQVAAELVAGASARESELLWAKLQGLPWTSLGQAGWRAVGETARELRRRGARVPLTDIGIALSAQRAGARLWSLDSDFKRIAEALDGLELYAD